MSDTEEWAGLDRPVPLATSHPYYNAQTVCAESGQGPTTPLGQSSSISPPPSLLHNHHARDAG